MRFEAFCGPSYTARSIVAASERTVNLNLELVETNPFKSRYFLYRSPGFTLFGNPAHGPARGSHVFAGRMFGVYGDRFGEWSPLGVFTDYSTASGVFIDGGNALVSMDSNPDQLMIVGGNFGYIFDFTANTLQPITSADFPAKPKGCVFQDGYFIVFIQNSQQFQISALNNGLVWDAADISEAEAKPDYILAMASVREQLWALGTETIQSFTNTGAADFPFQSNQGGVSETGIIAPASLTVLDNTIFYLGSAKEGGGIAVRMRGYAPLRISNYAVESAWQSYPSISDAEGLAFQMGGHLFYRLTFPSAFGGLGATWQYDVGLGMWTEVPYWNQMSGLEEAHRGRCASFCFGKVLIGDRVNGKVYELSQSYMTDNGDLIRRIRRAPHQLKERNMVYYQKLRFDANSGIGLDVAAGTAGYDPMMALRWSNDAGKTWSDETGAMRYIRFGRLGEYGLIPQTYGLGAARDRVYEAIMTDPVDWMIAAAYFDASS